jgi:hypothetical protein
LIGIHEPNFADYCFQMPLPICHHQVIAAIELTELARM